MWITNREIFFFDWTEQLASRAPSLYKVWAEKEERIEQTQDHVSDVKQL